MFVDIAIIFITLVKKFELIKHFQKTQQTFPQMKRNISPYKIPFGLVQPLIFWDSAASNLWDSAASNLLGQCSL